MKSSLWLLLTIALLVPANAQQYEKALPGYQYQFPRDHFDHPAYQTEWWYYTGNLKAADGHRFGFELTFFRQGVARDGDHATWHVHDVYMAHLALSDINGRRFYHTERLNRSGPGITGIDERSGTVWNGNWQAQIHDAQHHLQAVADNFAIDLSLASTKPPTLQGRNGVSQKSAGLGHASHYISLTRMLASGRIQLNGTSFQVEGSAWMDHEFFTGSLDTTESGWDWLSIQLDDNSELMLYRLRHKDGSIDPYSSGSYVDAQGKATFLSSADFSMLPEGKSWNSPSTHASYHIEWRVRIPRLALDLHISTPLPEQELNNKIGPSYWEGAIDISGQKQASSVHGVGYLEMTGYSANGSNPVLP